MRGAGDLPEAGILAVRLPIVVKAAVSALHKCVRRGRPPEPAPRLEVTTTPTLAIARDEYGNVLGGIRTPYVDVPIATLSGVGQIGSLFCILFGTTVPFDAATLAELCPNHGHYVRAVVRATARAVRQGYILRRDARLIKVAAARSDVGK